MRTLSFVTRSLLIVAAVLAAPIARADDEIPLRTLSDLPRHTVPAVLDGSAPAATGEAIDGVAKSRRDSSMLEAVDVCFRTENGTPELTNVAYSATSVRTQRLVEGATPKLEIVDAWVDGERRTHFVRKIDAPVVPVARGPRGIVAYAYRIGNVVVVFASAPPARAASPATCSIVQVGLSPNGKQGDERRVPLSIGGGAMVWLEASLSYVASARNHTLSVGFSSPED